ncbi:hypothetical protein ACFVT5_00240 [Streptomyces sp. NPDC058001]|uniref:hypothetical protein n=1 Tax=Streptomyces sp. NPDC058001 TaxID=3346300 RepID=UPI0036EA4DD6
MRRRWRPASRSTEALSGRPGPPSLARRSPDASAGGTTAVLGRADPAVQPGRAAPWYPDRVPWLGLVACAYALLQLLLVVPRLSGALGWDESVYVSQVDPRNPAAWFSAPRSRGTSFLVAPVIFATPSVLALRIALALGAAAALYGAFRVWRHLVGPAATALGALLFAGLWTTQLYGPQAMPNMGVALASVAAVGWFLRLPGHPRAGWWLAGSLTVVTLLRIHDAAWLGLPLLLTAAVVRARRRALPYLLGGLAAGAVPWAVEAYARWGSIRERLRVSSATEGGMGLHLNVGNAWRALDGPMLCRPCTGEPYPPVGVSLWWLCLPVLAAVAAALALRDRRQVTGGDLTRAEVTLLPLACAAAMAVPYVLLIGYAAPRFLLPTYALAALPVAALAVRAVHRYGRPAAAVVLLLVVAQLASQAAQTDRLTPVTAAVDQRYRAAADGLRALGLSPPCLVTGDRALPVAYDAGCASAQIGGNNTSVTRAELLRMIPRQPTAVLTAGGRRPPSYARDWTPYPLPHSGGLTAWRPPAG